MRIEILGESPTGYLAACVNELSRNADVHISILPPQVNTNFDSNAMFRPSVKVYPWDIHSSIEPQLPSGVPDLLLVAGWLRRPYLLRAKQLRGICRRIVTFDNQWLGTPRQWAASILRNFTMRPFFDMAFVPGLRQVRFARKLGFLSSEIRNGSYSCDYTLFSQQRTTPREREVIFAGRLVREKGIEILLDAYSQHVREAQDPLSLVCVGSGPLQQQVVDSKYVTYMPFLQPQELQRMLSRATVLVLPSLREPWGVILHEAAASGLPLIATTACGASDSFMNDANGWLIQPRDTRMLTRALNEAAAIEESTWQSMSLASRNLAAQVTPKTWADTLLQIASSPLNSCG